MATTPIASLVACSWCGLLAERGPICDACGSPVAETSSRTTVLRVPEASRHHFRGAVPASIQPIISAPARQATPAPVHPGPNGPEEGREASPPVARVAVVPRPDVPTTVIRVAPVSPVVRGTTPPPAQKPEPPVRAPIVAMPPPPAAPAQPGRRGPALSDMHVAALLAEDVLPETWGFDASADERKLFRRHKVLTTAGVVLGFAGAAELVDFLMSHLR